jgi:type IX secretion system PorP/SprF family membrane protein
MKRKVLTYIKNNFLVIILFFITVPSFAQQDAMYSQYMFNGLVINPAYAGSHDALSLNLAARKQWIEMEGAPSTQTFSVHSPLKKEKIALGAILINDQIGVTHQYGISGIYAYRIHLSAKAKLAVGLQAGVTQFNSRLSALSTRNAGDQSFSSDQVSGLIPSFGTGAYYTTPEFYLGFSIPHLVNNIFKDPNVAANILQRKHYLLTSGYVFTISPNLKLKPSILLKMAQGTPVQIDINTNALIKEVLWAGVSYRSSGFVNFLLQLQLTDQLRFGYSYDFGINELSAVNKGSHEIVLNYIFSFVKYKIVTPRYF